MYALRAPGRATHFVQQGRQLAARSWVLTDRGSHPVSHSDGQAPKHVNHLVLADFGLVMATHDPDIVAIGIMNIENLDVIWAQLMRIGNIATAIRYP